MAFAGGTEGMVVNFSRLRPPGLTSLDHGPELVDKLGVAGYAEEWTLQLARRVEKIPPRLMVAALLRECQGPSPVAVATRLWALSQWVERKDLMPVLGERLVLHLLDRGLLVARRQQLAASLDLNPVGGMWLASDRQFGSLGFAADAVYPPGLDSFCMARWTPRWAAGRALDLGTGSGIQALVTASSSARVEGFDLNPRAIDFSNFNASLNGCTSRCSFRVSDLYEAAEGQRYDLILSNPPWVPAPEGDIHLFRGGGVTGEELVERICRGLAEHLESRGRAVLYVEYPRLKGQNYLERVRGWLGSGPWGLFLLHRAHYSTVEYVAGHTCGHYQPECDFEKWCQSYLAQGIEGVSAGMLVVIRGGEGDLEEDGLFPDRFRAGPVQAWIDGCMAPLVLDSIPNRLGDCQFWVDPQGGPVWVEWPEGPFVPRCIDGPAAQLLALCDNQRSYAEIAQKLDWSESMLSLQSGQLRRWGVLRT